MTRLPNKIAAAGLASPATVVLVWLCGQFGVTMPPEVAAACVSLLTAAAYVLAPADLAERVIRARPQGPSGTL